MKKILSVVMLMAVLMGAFSVCAFADAKADIIAKAEEVCPDGYEQEYIPVLKNILNQITVTDEQAKTVIEALENSKAIVNSGKGTTLGDYTKEEKKHVIADLDKACKALNIEYTIVEKENITTVSFYLKANTPDAQDKLLGDVTIEDTVVSTGIEASAPATLLLVAAAAFVVLAGAAYVCQKNRA